MNRIRLASLVAAAVIAAIQWAPFFSPLAHAASLRLVVEHFVELPIGFF
jgi:hypothetical protein